MTYVNRFLKTAICTFIALTTGFFTSDSRAEILGDSIAQFSGTQGQDLWFYGYRLVNAPNPSVDYDPLNDFVAFLGGEGMGDWVANVQEWSGTAWDKNTASAAPWTVIEPEFIHPNGLNNGVEYWAIRRWFADSLFEPTSIRITWKMRKSGAGGNGVTGGVYLDGKRVDSAVIAGNDTTGVTRTVYVNADFGNLIDLVLTPVGTDGVSTDGSDGSFNSMVIDDEIPAVPIQPDGSLFVPVNAPDTDGDGIADVWELFHQPEPGDLALFSNDKDFDGDGSNDLEEFIRNTNPTETDTDGDGLSDGVETDTGIYAGTGDTGTDPLNADTDGDGLSDGAEVNGSKPSSPLLTDTDGDGFSDFSEISTGHDPSDPNNNENTTLIANSTTDFSGVQGQANWLYGYRNVTADGKGINGYNPTTDFIQFAGGSGLGSWDGVNQFWNGSAWDLNTANAAPWTFIGANDSSHPNGSNNSFVHWAIRRWVAADFTEATPVAVRYHIHKNNANGNGVTGGIYINGELKDSIAIAGNNQTGVVRTYYANLNPDDVVDLIHSPRGPDNSDADGSDSSSIWMRIDSAIPLNPTQPNGDIFIPAGSTDSDGDGIPDAWEQGYFPGDLTQLGGGDYDNDGSSDVNEYDKDTDPTNPDTDADGLKDGVETGTGIFVDASNTGTNPKAADTDLDGLSDLDEINGNPATNPNRADSDGDGFSDPSEIASGTDPNDSADNVLTFVIANSQAEFSGVQGQNGWYNGYRNYDLDGGGDYSVDKFIPYPGGVGEGDWDGLNQTWTGGSWDLNTAPAAPWTFQNAISIHPNSSNNGGEHWATRRWVADELTESTTVAVIWQVKKENLNGTGVTGALFVNGAAVDSQTIAGNAGDTAIRRYYAVLNPGDIIDLTLSPVGLNNDRTDGSDGSQTWFWVDTRLPREPRQPDGSLFIPDDTDSDADGLIDFWELVYADDLDVLTGDGDNDHDGLKNSDEQAVDANPLKADTDEDGLVDGVETGTGVFLSASDTGSKPGLADSDGDGFSDGLEVSVGSDPNNFLSTPLIGNSITEFSGVQGQDNWYFGYRNFTQDGGANEYDPETSFIPFAAEQFTGTQWDLETNPSAPWTELGPENTHPNGDNSGDIHWTIRRWVANELTRVTPLCLTYNTRKSNLGGGNGVTGALFLNGVELDHVTVAFNDGTGATRTYYVNANPGDIIDLVLSPLGGDGSNQDGADGSLNWLQINTIIPPNPTQPDGTPFMPEITANVAPSFTAGGDASGLEDSGPISIAGWATNINPGSPSEASQGLTFIVTENSNPDLFAEGPTVNADGTLNYTPAPNACGDASITLVLMDDGGTANGGQDTSAPASFSISIGCVNDEPTCANLAVNTDEDTPVDINLVAEDVDGDALTISVSGASHGSISGTAPALIYTPAANYYGPDALVYTVSDGISTVTCSVSIQVASINDAPDCQATVAPLVYLGENNARLAVVAGDNASASVALDASASSDVEGDSLTYLWFLDGDSVPFAEGATVGTDLEVGDHVVVLEVSDGADSCTHTLLVEIITPAAAVDELILLVNDSIVVRKNKQPWLASLKSASASYERGNTISGDNVLSAFINKLKAQLSSDNPDLAEEWTEIAESIQEATERANH